MRKLFILFLFLLPFSCWSYEVFTLENGLKIIFEPGLSNQVYFQVWVRTGSALERGYYGSGISHFIEHMIFKGREGEEPGQLAKRVRELGGDMGAYTSLDHTVYYMTLPREYLEEGLKLLSRAIFYPSFPEKEIKKEREVILREMDMKEDNPDSYLSCKMFEYFFSNHPYRFPIIGYRSLFLKLKREDLLKYHRKMYVPGNIILGIAGNYEVKKVKKYVEKYFSSIPPQPIPEIRVPQLSGERGRTEYKFFKDVKMERVFLAFPIPGLCHPDTYSLDLLSLALTDGESSILVEKLQKEKDLVSSVVSFSYTPPGTGIFAIKLLLKKDKREKALDELWRILSNLKNYLSEKDIERAKNRLLLRFAKERESLSSRLESMLSDLFYTGNPEYYSFYIKKIESLKKKDLIYSAKKYLKKELVSTFILTSPEKKIEKKKEEKKVKVEKITLSNGVRILIWEKDVPYLNLRVIMKGGVILESPDNNGATSFISRLLVKSKPGKKWVKVVEGKGGKISSGSGNNTLSLSLTLPSKYSWLGARAFVDILLHPQWEEKDFARIKRIILKDIEMREETPFSYAFYHLKKNFYEDHPYALPIIGEKESVKKLTLKDLKKFYLRTLLNPETMVVGIGGGGIDNSLLKEIRSSLKKLKPLPSPSTPPLPKFKRKRVEKKKDFRESFILMAFPIPPFNHPENPAMEIFSSFLTGQASPLFIHLRDEKALGYLVGSFTVQGWDTGMLVFYIGTQKGRLKEAEEGLREEISQIKKEGIPKPEFLGCAKKVIRWKNERMEILEAALAELMIHELYGLGYRKPLEWDKVIEKVSLQDVNRLSKKYLDFSKSCTFILVGEGE